MKKVILSCAMALALTTSVSANWVTGEQTVLAVTNTVVNENNVEVTRGGEAAFHLALTSDQRLDANLTFSDTARADLTFTTRASENILSKSEIPVLINDDSGYQDATLTITPLVNDTSGLRCYLISTGDVNGAFIISYKKGEFKEIFSGASLELPALPASFDVEKKSILFHAGDSNYTLSYDSKEGVFKAEKVSQ